MPKVLGNHEITYKAVDELNNWTSAKKLKLVLDLLPPFVEQKFEGPYIPVLRKYLYQKKQRFSSRRDIGSGVQAVRYKINDSNEKVFKSAFKLVNEGIYNFSFFSIDNVNNPQTPNSSKIVVDNTPPEIFHHFSNTGLGKKGERGQQINSLFSRKSSFLSCK